jgi:hypothetical protein
MKTLLGVGVLATLLLTLPVAAQPVIGAKSGIVNYVQGEVYLADKLLELQPAQFPEIQENTVVRSQDGLAEILLTPGVVLRIAENTSFKLISNRLIDTRLELLSGTAIVDAMEVAKDTSVTVVFKESTVAVTKAGIYRFDAKLDRLKVFKGSAEVRTGTNVVTVQTGKMLVFSGALAVAEKFSVDQTDSFDHWSRRRDEAMARSNISAANQARKTWAGSNPCLGRTFSGSAAMPLMGSWGYNPYYGFGTYIPCRGRFQSPYGFYYWSPVAVYREFFAPRPVYTFSDMGPRSYPSMGSSSGGYSGAAGSSGMSGGAVSAPPSAAASSGSSSAGAASSSSVGGGGGGGGRGR